MILLSIFLALAAALYVLAPLLAEPVNLDINYAADRQEWHRLARSGEFSAALSPNPEHTDLAARAKLDRLLKQRFDLNLEDLRDALANSNQS